MLALHKHLYASLDWVLMSIPFKIRNKEALVFSKRSAYVKPFFLECPNDKKPYVYSICTNIKIYSLRDRLIRIFQMNIDIFIFLFKCSY